MKKILLSAAITVGLAASATAQGAPSVDWSGFYLGNTLSATDGTQDYVNPNFSYDLIGTTALGGFMGYNIQRNRYVYGAELDITDGGNGLSPVGFPGENHVYFADLKARAGVAVNKALFYGVLGYSSTRFNNGIETVTLDGLSYGVGVDAMLNNTMFIGTELLVRDLDGPGNSATPLQTRETKTKSIHVRIGWKF